MTNKIDLHIHSTASDGQFTPTQVVEIALKKGLKIIALTDHDAVEGISEATAAAQGTGLTIIPGLEFGLEKGVRDVHVLAYAFDPEYQPLRQKLNDMRRHRETRAQQMVENLNAVNIPVTYERVLEIADGHVITRPHIAKALIEIGVARDYAEAFERLIGNDCPAYVPRLKITPQEGIDLIHQAGGVAVVAHPCRYEDPLGVVHEFISYGVDGVEIYYPDNDSNLRRALWHIVRQHELIVTGGCDFHRPAGDGQLVMGCEAIPMTVIDALYARANRYQPS
jgi:hypothetical protein